MLKNQFVLWLVISGNALYYLMEKKNNNISKNRTMILLF